MAVSNYRTKWYTAVINETPFTALDPVIFSELITVSTYFHVTYAFPDLTVTSLTPGQYIEMVSLCFILRLN